MAWGPGTDLSARRDQYICFERLHHCVPGSNKTNRTIPRGFGLFCAWEKDSTE